MNIRFVSRRDPSALLLVLFHKDGGDERESLAIGRKLWPGAPSASLRGSYRERAGWRHVSSPAHDLAELAFETGVVERLADGVATVARREPQLIEVIGVGMGGGADAVVALLCRHPGLLAGAILCRPQRRWSQASVEQIERGNGVEVLITTDYDGIDLARTAKTMVSLAGHYTEIKLVAREDEIAVCRSWPCRELRGETGDAHSGLVILVLARLKMTPGAWRRERWS